MAVLKALDLIGEAPTVHDAVSTALDRAQLTIEGVTSFQVRDVSGVLDEGRPVYRVQVRVWFTVLDHMHG
jgi:flavin-binding protein dodecin